MKDFIFFEIQAVDGQTHENAVARERFDRELLGQPGTERDRFHEWIKARADELIDQLTGKSE